MAANPVKGEADVGLADGRVLTLAIDFDAIAQAQRLAGKPFFDIVQQLGDIEVFAAMFLAALGRHHPEMSEDEVKSLLLPNFAGCVAALQEALATVLGEAAETGAAGPPKGAAANRPPRGTSTRSSRSRAKRD
jgi:hypothetical protein